MKPAWAAVLAVAALPVFSLRADTVYMVDGLAISGKVREVTDERVFLLLDDGVIGIPRQRIKRIDYDIESRKTLVAPDDFNGRYELALLALDKNRRDVAVDELKASAGKPGVPPEAWKKLAFILRDAGDDKGAFIAVSEYLKLAPEDPEAAALQDALAKKITPPKPAQQPAPPPAAGATQQPVETKPSPEPAQAQPQKPEGLEDDRWQVEGWGNPATVQVTVSDGNKMLAIVSPEGGKQDKTAVSVSRRLDLSGKKRLLFSAHVEGAQPLQLAVAFITDDYYESRLVALKPGWNTDVAIDVSGQDFKSRATNWAFKTPINNLNRVNRLVFLIYNFRVAANIFLDDIRVE